MATQDLDRNVPAGAITVAIVDDEFSLRVLLTKLLKTTGRMEPVGSAADGAEAVRLAAATQPDIVLLDLLLVGERGTDLIVPIREAAPRAMIAMLTALPAKHEERACLEAGAFVFHEKSVLPQLETRLLADYERFREADPGGAVASPPVAGQELDPMADDGSDGLETRSRRDAPAELALLTSGDAHLRAYARSLVELMAAALQGIEGALWWHDDAAAHLMARYPKSDMPTVVRFVDMPEIRAGIQAGRSEVYERRQANGAVRGWMDRANLETWLRIPILANGAPSQFFLTVSFREESPPFQEVLPLAERFARHAGVALTNAMSRRTRQETVIELSDNVAQALVVARGALELGETGNAQDAVDRAYSQLQHILVGLLDEGATETIRRLEPSDQVPGGLLPLTDD